MENEMEEANIAIKKELGVQATTFAYPRGQKFIGRAKEQGSWLVFAGHEVGPAGKRQTVLADNLQAICEYCRNPQNEVWIDTVECIGTYIRTQRRILK
jgi:hypothetical protein